MNPAMTIVSMKKIRCWLRNFMLQRIGAYFPSLVVDRLETLWFSTKRYPVPARESSVLALSRRRQMVVSEGQCEVYQWGKSIKKVLLVHGWNGRATQLGAIVNPLLAEGYEIIGFDAYGHGASSGNCCTLFAYLHGIQQLVNDFGEFDTVVAHSFGGLAVARAIQLGMISPKSVVYVAVPTSLLALFLGFSRQLNLPVQVQNALSMKIQRRLSASVWEEITMANMTKHVSQPTLIFHDCQDQQLPIDVATDYIKADGRLKFCVTNGLGHNRILRDEVVIQSIKTFITTNS